jgi:DNA-binding IclR family transcriptional regulator
MLAVKPYLGFGPARVVSAWVVMTRVSRPSPLEGGDLATPAGLAGLPSLGRRRSAAETAYEALRAALISLALPPGTVLSRSAVAARLGVSQMPVREALIRLQEEGLIEVVPHSATRVSRIDLASAREAGFLRLAVELEIVRRLASAPADAALAAALRAELARIRRLGCATARGEIEEGLNAVAAPVRNRHGQVIAAVSVSGPAYRMTAERLRELGPLTVRTAEKISARMGYNLAGANGNASR